MNIQFSPQPGISHLSNSKVCVCVCVCVCEREKLIKKWDSEWWRACLRACARQIMHNREEMGLEKCIKWKSVLVSVIINLCVCVCVCDCACLREPLTTRHSEVLHYPCEAGRAVTYSALLRLCLDLRQKKMDFQMKRRLLLIFWLVSSARSEKCSPAHREAITESASPVWACQGIPELKWKCTVFFLFSFAFHYLLCLCWNAYWINALCF